MMSPRLQALLTLHRNGRVQEAETGYRTCLREGDADAGRLLAALLLQQQRFIEAVGVLEPLVGAAPDNAELAVNLSVALRRTGRLHEALQVAERARTLAPAQASCWNALGLAALELDRNEQALAAFDSGLALAPSHPALILHRAHALRRLGRNADALPAFAQVVAADPGLLDGWRGLANTQASLGRLDAALRSRERALALAPDDPEVAFELAVALLQSGSTDAAAERLEAALQAGADDAQVWSWLGRARIKQGDLPAARAAFAQAHARDPDDPVIGHFQAALSGALPQAVESEYIRDFFNAFADRFEPTLVGNLAYDTPARLARALGEHGADSARSVLDLGCGTGLMAQALARPGRVFDGVDLSPRMLEHARAKGLYRNLHAAEIIEFLHGARAQWDLILAADVFVYIAGLQPLFAAVAARLAPGGCFAFSIEASATADTELLPATGRYRHAPARVERELADAGFVDIVREAIVVRLESGQPVAGELILARRPSAA
jgi:predicted TPR repeat methyltransferase